MRARAFGILSKSGKAQFRYRASLCRFFSAQPQPEENHKPIYSSSDQEIDDEAVFNSKHYELPNNPTTPFSSEQPPQLTWDDKYREKANLSILGEEFVKKKKKDDEDKRRRVLAKALLEAALENPDDEEENEEDRVVKEEDQMSLSVGIIGAPNAGKSALTNFMVGTKVSGVSRKTNTTTHEVLGVMTKGNTQICFFDTPGLMLKNNGYPYTDMRVRVQGAWSSVNLYDVLIVLFDVHRHLEKPDSRVVRLIEHMGEKEHPTQKRVLCMNKVDLVEAKKDLLRVADEFKHLPGYERYFMISGLKGSGVKDLTQYLTEKAVKRPWDEDPFVMSEDIMKIISLEVVRERLLEYVHEEIPYCIEHRLIGWKELRDGSLRIEQHFITHKQSQRKILVGKKGSKIGLNSRLLNWKLE
ncbi:GTP binding domain, partial [Dillenia turbinata]